MIVVRTDNWIEDAHGDPLTVCKQLTELFPAGDAAEIHTYLMMFGMYRTAKQGRRLCKKLYANRAWEIALNELVKLQTEWKGPSVPVYIFPADSDNEVLTREFNGKSGLAYADKLFVFISPQNTDTEIRALLTHEYNHVCRLNSFSKRENDYTLLDTIVLEGLAEMAVEKRFGKASTSFWTSLYSEEQLAKLWKNVIYPNRERNKKSAIHQEILYGLGRYPQMAGYAVGYYIVRNFLRETDFQLNKLFSLSSQQIAKL